jgi:hypothetical protein
LGSPLRTLVISDLHFGTRAAPDVLRDPAVRAPLLTELAGCDRLVLLGDLLELRHGPVREALAAAREPLAEIGAALGPEGEVIVLGGNHDHHLMEAWLARRAADGAPAPLGRHSAVDWRPGEPLAQIAELLAPARMSAAYPGVWLREDVYAIHGHYLDLHLTVPTLERLGAGLMGRVVGLRAPAPQVAEDYEMALAPLYAWVHAIAQVADPERSRILHGGSVRGWRALTGARGGRRVRRAAIAGAFPVLVAALNRAGLGPLRAELSGPVLRSSGLRALEQVTERLGVEAGYVIFGHTHRAGPLPGNDPAEWRTAAGAQLINSGSWVREDAFLGDAPSESPYRPGFAVRIEDEGPPQLVNLLDRPVPA